MWRLSYSESVDFSPPIPVPTLLSLRNKHQIYEDGITPWSVALFRIICITKNCSQYPMVLYERDLRKCQASVPADHDSLRTTGCRMRWRVWQGRGPCPGGVCDTRVYVTPSVVFQVSCDATGEVGGQNPMYRPPLTLYFSYTGDHQSNETKERRSCHA